MNQTQKDKLWPELQRYIPFFFRPFLDTPSSDSKSLWKGNIKQGNHHSVLTIMALTLELEGAFKNEYSV